MFGFLIELDNLKNLDSLFWSIPISLGIYFIRFIFLAIIKKLNASLMFNTPRGLITILLFVTIDAQYQIEYINNSLITQVIIITSVLLIFSQFQSKEHTPAEVVEETTGK